MANFCSNCGKALKPTANFCPECGKKVFNVTSNETRQNSSNTDILAAGAGGLAGVIIATAEETSQAQVTNVNPATTSASSNEIFNELIENFFGLAVDGLQNMTGTVDVTNIVASVANAFGVVDVAEYIDVTTEGTDELVDVASEAVGDVAGDALGSIFDFF